MRFQLVIDYTGLDGVATSSKHDFDAIDLEHAVSIGRKLVEKVVLENANDESVGGFYIKRMK